MPSTRPASTACGSGSRTSKAEMPAEARRARERVARPAEVHDDSDAVLADSEAALDVLM